MGHRVAIPFDSIENAQQYVKLFAEAVAEAKRDIDEQMIVATDQMSHRRVQALRMVQLNLEKLQRHFSASSRILNDLRTLRRLLLEERDPANVTKSILTLRP